MPTLRRSCLLLTVSLAAAAASAEPTVYFGLTLLDPVSQRATTNAYLVVDDTTIASIGEGEPPAWIPRERWHDFSGHFAIPGLFDTHAHITRGPVQRTTVASKPLLQVAGNESIARHDALMMLAHGITTFRDPGGHTPRVLAYRRAVAAQELLGPEARVAGEAIQRSPAEFLNMIARVTPENSVEKIVRRQAAAGVDYVKLYEALRPEDLQAGIGSARAAGVGTIAHLGDVSWTTAAEMGIDALVHMMPASPDLLPEARRQEYLTHRRGGTYAFFEWYEAADLGSPEIREMIDTLARRRVWLDATMIVFKLAFWGDDPKYRDADLAEAHPAFAANWQAGFRFDARWKPEDYRRAKAVWPKVLRLARTLYEAGVPMTIGTDMSNPFVAPGASLVREMRLHADAGIPAWAILRMATHDAARLLQMEKRTGRLAPGMEADVVILRADPSLDISAVSQVTAVMNNGRLYRPQELRQQARRYRPDASCGDACTPDSVVTAVYDYVSTAPGQGWDWERIRALFYGDGLFATAPAEADGAKVQLENLDALSARAEMNYRQSGLIEREIKRQVRVFGNMASVYSSFYLQRREEEAEPIKRGLHHFQLLRSGGRWFIISNSTMLEDAGWSLPPEFLP